MGKACDGAISSAGAVLKVVTVNGFPKTGNHALKKGVELLGVAPVELRHEPYGNGFTSDGPMLVPIRHPRNVLISKCRWEGLPVVSGPLMNLIRSFDGKPMNDGYRSFLEWDAPGVLLVSYEELIASDAVLRRIADYLGVPFLEDAFPNLLGLTISWSGSPSRWEDYWTDAVDGAWTDSGMAALQRDLGY